MKLDQNIKFYHVKYLQISVNKIIQFKVINSQPHEKKGISYSDCKIVRAKSVLGSYM